MLFKEQNIFYGTLSFMWLDVLWELYLSARQRKVYKDVRTVPGEFQEVFSEETFEKARLYGMDRSAFIIITDIIAVIVTTVILLLDGISFFWKLSESTMAKLGYESYHETLDSVVFVMILDTLSAVISFPFSVYHIFVLEEKYGFNKQTFGFFIKDEIKSFVVSHIIFLPLIVAIIYIVNAGGEYFFIYLYIFTIVTGFLFISIYPICIAPLFDKFTPLPDGNLKTRIEELAASIGFPLHKLYVVEGSKRSGHSNAYLYGFFNSKRIVLYDTLLKDYVPENESATSKEDVTSDEKKGCDDDEVLAVLGHELGHWKFNHFMKHIIILLMNLFLVFYVFGMLYKYEPIYRAFGFHDRKPVLIGLLIVNNFIISPYRTISGFLMNVFSRHLESQADAFVKTLEKSQFLRSALIKLTKDNLEYPVYDWLYSMWYHSHPPVLERIRALKDKEE